MIVKTDAVVLRSMRFRETSKIVTFYTRQYGKLAGVAKGARETKSKFGAALEPMTAVSLVLYKKDNRNLQLVSQCDIRKPFKRIHSEMERMAAALSIVELLHQVTHDEQEQPSLFLLLEETLDALESASGTMANFRYGFELRMSAAFGFTPVFDHCVGCGKKGNHARDVASVVFQLDKGGMVCAECSARIPSGLLRKFGAEEKGWERGSPYRQIRSSTGLMMERLYSARLDSLGGLEYQGQVGNELDATLRSYLRYHFESVRPLKSAGVFEKLSM